MAVKILNGNSAYVLQGSPDKRIFTDGNGTYWAMVVKELTHGVATFYFSTNSGQTWQLATTSDIELGQTKALPSIHLDEEGYAHVGWVRNTSDPQYVMYARGKPVITSATYDKKTKTTIRTYGWDWSYEKMNPAAGRLGSDSDIIAFRNGAGWVAWIAYTQAATGGIQVARVNITSKGTPFAAGTSVGPNLNLEANQFGSLEFAHLGDGARRQSDAHVFLTTALNGSVGGIRIYKAENSGSTWTWHTPLTLGTGNVDNQTLCSIYDGERLIVAYSAGTSSVTVYEWDGGTPVSLGPPALPGGTGTVAGLSLAHDTLTDDFFLACYGVTNSDIKWTKYSRGAGTWSAWATLAGRPASTLDGQISLPRHANNNTILALYTYPDSPYLTVYSTVVQTIPRTPAAPTLISPSPSERVNLGAGATFTWSYRPVSPGDEQIQYVFRRDDGTTVTYWNAATQSFQLTSVNNTADPDNPTSVTFPSGKWVTGGQWDWSVKAISTSGYASAFSPVRTVYAVEEPKIRVTAPDGVVYEDSSPLVTWQYVEITAQQFYQIRIVKDSAGIDPDNPGPSVWSSGVTASYGARSQRIEVPLNNNTTYRAYVKVEDFTGLESTWEYSSFTISVTPPNGPLVEVVDWVDYDSNVPRVRLDLMGQSSYLSAEQDSSSVGWVTDANALVEDQVEDQDNSLLAGFKMSSNAAGNMRARTLLGDPPEVETGEVPLSRPLNFPVQEAIPYTFMFSARAATSARLVRAIIRWYDDDDDTGSLISESVGTSVNVTNTAYTGVFVTALAPSGALLATVVVEVLATAAAAEYFYFGYLSFHPGREVAYQPGGYWNRSVISVGRSDDGGETFTLAAGEVKPNYRQIAQAYDREMPFGTDVIYRAFTIVDLGSGATIRSAASLYATINLKADRWAIRDLTSDDAGELYAYVVGWKSSDDESSSVHRPAGRYFPIVDTEGLQAPTGSLDIFVPVGEIDTAIELLRRTSTFVLQSPSGARFYARLTRRDYTIEELRHRTINVNYTEVSD